MRRIEEHICCNLVQKKPIAGNPVLPHSPEPCNRQVNVKPRAPSNLAKGLRTTTLTNRPHAQIHWIRVLNPAAILEVNQSFHSVSEEIIVLATDSSAQKTTRKPKLKCSRNNEWTLESLARVKCFLQGSVAGKLFIVPLNEQKSKCEMKLRKKQIQGHRLVEITNACSNYFLYERKTHACFAMHGVL